MDPNQTLEEIRGLLQALRRAYKAGQEPIWGIATPLAQKVHALDEWLSRGGFLPKDWRAER